MSKIQEIIRESISRQAEYGAVVDINMLANELHWLFPKMSVDELSEEAWAVATSAGFRVTRTSAPSKTNAY